MDVQASAAPQPRLNNGLFTSATEEWGTPSAFFDQLDAEFHFTLDVCATAENAKCPAWFGRQHNGLAQPWTGVCWMNPPHGRGIGAWVKKAWVASKLGATVVCLIPARTETGYWHDYVMRAAEIRLVRGRLHFEGPSDKGHNAPFPSAVVVFRPGSRIGVPLLAATGRG